MLSRVALAALLGFCLSACATTSSSTTITVSAPSGAREEIPFTLAKPDGPGPFPAIVIMHDCSGLGPRSSGAPGRWVTELVARGYVVAIPDSFTTRGHPGGVCTDASPSRNDVSPARRVLDAYGAAAYLRTLPFVDARRVGLMGGSHGGTTTLSAMFLPESGARNAQDSGVRFAAAVALYPNCATRFGNWRGDSGVYKALAPVLILIGAADDWTPAEPCRKLAEDAAAAGYSVRVKIYPGALHAFDSDRKARYVAERINRHSPTGRGATTGGDPEAWADSIREVATFFGQHLGQQAQ